MAITTTTAYCPRMCQGVNDIELPLVSTLPVQQHYCYYYCSREAETIRAGYILLGLFPDFCGLGTDQTGGNVFLDRIGFGRLPHFWKGQNMT